MLIFRHCIWRNRGRSVNKTPEGVCRCLETLIPTDRSGNPTTKRPCQMESRPWAASVVEYEGNLPDASNHLHPPDTDKADPTSVSLLQASVRLRNLVSAANTSCPGAQMTLKITASCRVCQQQRDQSCGYPQMRDQTREHSRGMFSSCTCFSSRACTTAFAPWPQNRKRPVRPKRTVPKPWLTILVGIHIYICMHMHAHSHMHTHVDMMMHVRVPVHPHQHIHPHTCT